MPLCQCLCLLPGLCLLLRALSTPGALRSPDAPCSQRAQVSPALFCPAPWESSRQQNPASQARAKPGGTLHRAPRICSRLHRPQLRQQPQCGLGAPMLPISPQILLRPQSSQSSSHCKTSWRNPSPPSHLGAKEMTFWKRSPGCYWMNEGFGSRNALQISRDQRDKRVFGRE